MHTPGVIRYSLWRMAAGNPQAVCACINSGEAGCPRELSRRSVCVSAGTGDVPAALV